MDDLSAVDTEALLQQSRQIREDASSLLREYRLVEHFQQYGEVQLTGSYRWDVMLDPDLDLYVITPDLTLDLALDAFTQCVRRGDFLWFGFADSVRGKPPWEVPEGYYLGMSREFRGRRWKVDTWFLSASPSSPGWLEEPMTDRGRRVILRLKQARSLGKLSVSSYHMYEAVILGGLSAPEDVLAWVRK